MEKDHRIAFCVHCGNVSTHRAISTHEAYEKDFYGEVGEWERTPIRHHYFFAVCETCESPQVYECDEECIEEPLMDGPDELSEFQSAKRLWPEIPGLSDAVPKLVRRDYEEALRILKLAPTAFAVQIRRCLESICDDRGAAKGNLHTRLRDLAFKNEMPPVLAEMSDVLRVLGNVGAHSGDQHIAGYDAKVIDQFFRTIIEYVYEAPRRIQEFRVNLRRFGRSDVEPSDGDHATERQSKPPIN